MTVHPQLRALFGELDASGVEWCLLRGERFLAVPTGDVDLLVAGDDLAAAEEVFFSLGYAALPRTLSPRHRFYLLRDRASGLWLKLDVVTRLDFGRDPVLRSGLESGCLARSGSIEGVRRLDVTDQFWTVALHCMLDKRSVSDRRAAELTGFVDSVHRPSDGETFLAGRLGTGTPDVVLAAVAAGDWSTVVSVVGPRPPTSSRSRGIGRRLVAARSAAFRAARPLYPALWRGSGLGAVLLAPDVVEECGVDVAVVDVRRRPLLSNVAVLVRDHEIPLLTAGLRRHGFRCLGGSWLRGRFGRVERVVVQASSLWLPSDAATAYAFSTARRLRGRRHWLIPSPSTRLLLAARSMRLEDAVNRTATATAAPRGLDELRDLSDGTWREARTAATSWGVASELSALATAVGVP